MKKKAVWLLVGVLFASNLFTGYGLLDRALLSDDLGSQVSYQADQIHVLESLASAFGQDLTLEQVSKVVAPMAASELIKMADDQTLEVGGVTLTFQDGRLTQVRAW